MENPQVNLCHLITLRKIYSVTVFTWNLSKVFQSSLFSEQVLAPLLWHIFPMGFLLFSEKEICKQNFEKATSPKYWCSSVIIVIFIIQPRFQGTIFPAFLQWSRSPRNVMQIDYSESFQIFSRKQPWRRSS